MMVHVICWDGVEYDREEEEDDRVVVVDGVPTVDHGIKEMR